MTTRRWAVVTRWRRGRSRLPLTSLLAAATLGCVDWAQQRGVVEHPIADSMSVNPDEALVVRRSDSESEPLWARAAVERLRRRTVTATIGAPDGDAEYLFGLVVDATFLSDGSLAVLDRQGSILRVYGPGGEHRYSVGGLGKGPGELDVPVALVAPNAFSLWILDGAQAIHRFRDVNGRLTFVDRLPIESFPRDACTANGSVVVHMPAHQPEATAGGVLFRYDPGGTARAQFAVPYRYLERLVANRMKRGFITCSNTGVVLLGFEYMNRLDAYRVSDGALLWHATFEDVRIPKLRESRLQDGRPSVQAAIDEYSSFHQLLSVVGGDGMPVVVQYGRRRTSDVRAREDRYVVETFLVLPESGQGIYVGEDLPQLLALTGDRVVALYVEPYPRVEVATLAR